MQQLIGGYQKVDLLVGWHFSVGIRSFLHLHTWMCLQVLNNCLISHLTQRELLLPPPIDLLYYLGEC